MTKLSISAVAAALLGGTVLCGAVASAAPAGPSTVMTSPDGLVVPAQMTKREKMMMKKKKMMMMKKKDRMMSR